MSCTGRASRPSKQPAMIEEDVHELPEHVVERLDELLATNGSSIPRGSSSHSAPVPGEARSSGTRARARPPAPGVAGGPKPMTMSSGSASSATGPRASAFAARPSAGSARLPTMTGCTNSTATCRASDQAAGVVAHREQTPAAGEALGHAVTQRAMRLGLAREELPRPPRRGRAAARRGARPHDGCGRVAHAGAPAFARAGSAASHSRKASTPSPVRALTSMRCARG